MAADTVLVNVDTVEKSVWDGIVAAGTAEKLPIVSSTDNGKVLGVSSGKWDKVDAPSSLPAVSGTDNGKLLGVSSGKWDKVDAPSGLPTVSASDNGKVLGVSAGEWAAVAGTVPLIVNLVEAEGEMTLDPEFSEIAAAWAANRTIYVQIDNKRIPIIELEATGEDAGFTASLTFYMGDNTGVIFSGNYSAEDGSMDYTNHSFSVTEVND